MVWCDMIRCDMIWFDAITIQYIISCHVTWYYITSQHISIINMCVCVLWHGMILRDKLCTNTSSCTVFCCGMAYHILHMMAYHVRPCHIMPCSSIMLRVASRRIIMHRTVTHVFACLVQSAATLAQASGGDHEDRSPNCRRLLLRDHEDISPNCIMRIEVRTAGGSCCEIAPGQHWTCHELTDEIRQKLNVHEDQQRLIYRGKTLQEFMGAAALQTIGQLMDSEVGEELSLELLLYVRSKEAVAALEASCTGFTIISATYVLTQHKIMFVRLKHVVMCLFQSKVEMQVVDMVVRPPYGGCQAERPRASALRRAGDERRGGRDGCRAASWRSAPVSNILI